MYQITTANRAATGRPLQEGEKNLVLKRQDDGKVDSVG